MISILERFLGMAPAASAAPMGVAGAPDPVMSGLLGQTAAADMLAPPMQVAGNAELENIRRILANDKMKPAVPRKEIKPEDALENLRRLIRENS